MKTRLLFILLVFFSNSCNLLSYQEEEEMDTLTFINLSDKDLLFEDLLFKQSFDTTIPEMSGFSYSKYKEGHTLKAKDTIKFNTWLTVRSIDYFIVFFYDENIVNTTPWDTIRAKYMILKRYDLSYEDVERMNWTITYH